MFPDAAAERPSMVHSFSISVLLRNPGTGGFPEPLRIADKWEDSDSTPHARTPRDLLPREAARCFGTALSCAAVEIGRSWWSLARPGAIPE